MRLAFNARPWRGMRFFIPVPPKTQSSHALSRGISERGGVLVGAEGPVDILVLPEPSEPSRRHDRIAARWLEEGAVVMWEQAFLKAMQWI